MKTTENSQCEFIGITVLVLAVLFSCIVNSANATEVNRDEPKFNLYLSAYRPQIDTVVRLDSRFLGNGSTINLEDSTKLDDSKTLGAISLSYQASAKLTLVFNHFQLNRSGTTQLTEEIRFGEETFSIDETINSVFDVGITRVGMTYNFYQNSDLGVSVTGGAHITDFDLGITAREGAVGERAEGTAPLPYIGFNIDYRINDNWKFGINGDYFSLSFDDTDGALTNVTLALEYVFRKDLSLGFGYNVYDLNVEAEDLTDDLAGSLDYRYSGPLLYVRFRL